jgi:DNA replication protein DnaC
MNELIKSLGLTQLAHVLPSLLDDARQQQLPYEAFLRAALDAEVQGRQQRALERRIRAARLPSQTWGCKPCCTTWKRTYGRYPWCFVC